MTAPNPERDVVLVPREPTEEMIRAASVCLLGCGWEVDGGEVDFRHAYRAMLSAAPAALQPSPDGVEQHWKTWANAKVAEARAAETFQRERAERAEAALPPVSGGGLGEPVAWRYRRKGPADARWSICEREPRIRDTHEVQPLYARQQAAPCAPCKGKGFQPGDPEGAPIEDCDYCGGTGRQQAAPGREGGE